MRKWNVSLLAVALVVSLGVLFLGMPGDQSRVGANEGLTRWEYRVISLASLMEYVTDALGDRSPSLKVVEGDTVVYQIDREIVEERQRAILDAYGSELETRLNELGSMGFSIVAQLDGGFLILARPIT